VLNGLNLVSVSTGSGKLFYRLTQTSASTSASTVMYMGTDGTGSLGALESEDGGISWSVSGPGGLFINALAVNPADPTMAYLGASGGRDGFVTVLSPTGQLLSSSYLGGRGNDEFDGVLISGTDIFSTGSTFSDDFPTVSGPLFTKKLGLLKKDKSTKNSPGIADPRSAVVFDFNNELPCPPDETIMLPLAGEPPILVGDHLALPIHFFRGATQIDVTGGAPGLSIDDSGFFTMYFSLLHGNPTQAGTFTISVTFTEESCEWTRTFIIKVLQ
jgi:hypothetical protein